MNKLTVTQISELPAEKQTELYYRAERLIGELKEALKATREEPGLGLIDVSYVIKKVFSKEEVAILVKELNK